MNAPAGYSHHMVHPLLFVFLVGVVLGGLLYVGGYGRLPRREWLMATVLTLFAAGAALTLALPQLRN